MSVLYIIIPLSVCMAGFFVFLCLAAIKTGQFQDLESPRWRVLFDNDTVILSRKDNHAEN